MPSVDDYACRSVMISSFLVKSQAVPHILCLVPFSSTWKGCTFHFFSLHYVHFSRVIIVNYAVFFLSVWPSTSWKCNFNKKIIVLKMISQFCLLFGIFVWKMSSFIDSLSANTVQASDEQCFNYLNGLPTNAANVSSIFFFYIYVPFNKRHNV